MAKISGINIDATQGLKSLKIEIKVVKAYRARIRLWLAKCLVGLAARILNCNISVIKGNRR